MVPAYHVGDVGLCALDGTKGSQPARGRAVKKNCPGPHTEQSERIQDRARARVPLSVSEIRRLFWRLVLATQQRVERILAWSTWRRWHQGLARYWHYKWRAGPEVQL